ncbi:hypothetical protein BDZ97DRAFT_1013846 [Flammula alnicola]|nr:hypothetical protein BDZ97DRAFT_1013846 [Flammula alnicola]
MTNLARSLRDSILKLHIEFTSPILLLSTTTNTSKRTIEAGSAPADTCRQVKCETCGKITWAGCGQHVEAVMQGVKEEDKCTCPRN